MSEDSYVVLDRNLVPMLSRNVYGEVVKCFLSKPVGVSSFYSPNLFLTKEEIQEYDERFLDFAYVMIRKGVFGYELKKAFTAESAKEVAENGLV